MLTYSAALRLCHAVTAAADAAAAAAAAGIAAIHMIDRSIGRLSIKRVRVMRNVYAGV